jgi:hypothetical protein
MRRFFLLLTVVSLWAEKVAEYPLRGSDGPVNVVKDTGP